MEPENTNPQNTGENGGKPAVPVQETSNDAHVEPTSPSNAPVNPAPVQPIKEVLQESVSNPDVVKEAAVEGAKEQDKIVKEATEPEVSDIGERLSQKSVEEVQNDPSKPVKSTPAPFDFSNIPPEALAALKRQLSVTPEQVSREKSKTTFTLREMEVKK